MKLFFLIVTAFAVAASGRILVRRSTSNIYKMCVPEQLLSSCEQMSKQDTKSSAQILCIPARDRIECIEKISEKQADFVVVDPEDMYIAKNINNLNNDNELAIFEEIRTREEPEAEFRYEGVAVVHKDLPIESIQDLKGLKSCHTGVGRNVGYKIPLTKLRQLGVIGLLNEQGLSARENELKALSKLFSKACIVGAWSPDEELNKHLKERYSNLCALCEDPAKCDYPDKYSGYDGALRCLTQNGGQIAWTKVIYVRKFFGLQVGSNPVVPAESQQAASDYTYLCPDGTRVPVTSAQPCRWAARPWQGYMANAAVVKTIDELRTKIENLNSAGAKGKQEWLTEVLELSDKQIPVANKMISPGDYLDKGNYTDVIERDYGPPVKTIRMCVTTEDEFSKCVDLSKSAFTRNIRPRLQCSRLTNVQACMKLVRDNGADIMKIDAGLVNIGIELYNLKPIVREEYLKEKLDKYYAVGVVRKNSNINSFQDLKNTKSCHVGYGTSAGYNAVIHTLIQLKLIESKCPQVQELAKFFSGGSCLPDVRVFQPDLDADIMKSLYSVCGGEEDPKVDLYRGYTGALRCLVEGKGDVAFISHITVPQNAGEWVAGKLAQSVGFHVCLNFADGNNKAQWALDLKSSDYELLCPNGGRAPVDQYERCHMMQTPPHMVVTSNVKNNDDINEIQHALLEMSELYSERPDLFRMFGNYNGKPDVLFKNAATGLKAIHGKPDVPEGYGQILEEINSCN